MEQQQQQQQHFSFPARASPPMSPMVAVERYNRQMLRKAKLSVVKSDYKNALRAGNEFLRQQLKDDWSGPLSYFQTTVQLSTPLIIPTSSNESTGEIVATHPDNNNPTANNMIFQVRFGTQLTAVDEMAAIVLQSWHELARKDNHANSHHSWKHLLPLLEIYSKHPMPIQFFVQIWIPFWHSLVPSWMVSSNHNNMNSSLLSLALAWSLQVSVLLVEQSLRIEGTPALLLELRDQLVEFVLVQQLSKLPSETLAREMAVAVLTPHKESLEHLIPQINDHHLDESSSSSRPHRASVQSLRRLLLDNSSTESPSNDLLRGLSTELRQSILQHYNDTLRNLPGETMVRSSYLVSNGGRRFSHPQRKLLIPKFVRERCGFEYIMLPLSIQTLWDRLRRHAAQWIWSLRMMEEDTDSSSSSSSSSNNRSRNNTQIIQWRKTQVAISIISLLLAWRHRVRLIHCSKSVSLALLAPITELIEALAPATMNTGSNKSR